MHPRIPFKARFIHHRVVHHDEEGSTNYRRVRRSLSTRFSHRHPFRHIGSLLVECLTQPLKSQSGCVRITDIVWDTLFLFSQTAFISYPHRNLGFPSLACILQCGWCGNYNWMSFSRSLTSSSVSRAWSSVRGALSCRADAFPHSSGHSPSRAEGHSHQLRQRREWSRRCASAWQSSDIGQGPCFLSM